MNTQALRFKLTDPIKLAVCSLLLASVVSQAAPPPPVDLSNTPLTTSTATAMRPNIMFVLDDSGSMAWKFMPDYVDDSGSKGLCKKDNTTTYNKPCVPADPPYFSAGFNGMYYNPTFVYLPPVNADGSLKPNQFNMNGSTKEWKQVQSSPYVNASAKDNIQENYPDQQWCTSQNVTDAQRALTNGAYCRVNGRVYASIANPGVGAALPAATNAYNYPDATFKFGDDGTGNGNGKTFTTANTNPVTVSPPFYYNLASMQWCDAWTGGNCGARRDPLTNKIKTRYGAFTRVDITPANCPVTSGCPGGRSYAAEMTNFANWYAYYRDRINMMKTGVGRAFGGLDDNYRVGFMTIHTTSTSTSNFLQNKTFDAAQKTTWYNKLYSISPNDSTPLRAALSTAGQMYAGKALVDPVQYSCQKNFTILSTDGFWNGGAGFKIDNSAIGNQDNVLANAPRPKYDGNLLPTTAASASSGTKGGAETLSDVALYYYNTDLRTSGLSNCTGALGVGTDVCQNNVAPTKKDPASHQHMTVFTIGLGVDGLLGYRPDYETAATGDFAQIRAGTKNWPSPTNDDDTAVDDLWHAAVNAGGTYYSAKNPQALSDGLGDALREVGSRGGSAAAASTSNPQVTTTDNFVFSANYRTAFWDSVIRRRRIDVRTGELSKNVDWEAGSILNTMVSASSDVRTIYMFSGASANKLKTFEWSNLTVAEKAHLDVNSWADPTKLSQWAGLSAIGQTAAKVPGALVGFIRGQGGLEDDNGSADIPFRGRENVLGDIVSAETIYMKKSNFDYLDTGHTAFRSSTASRQGVLFAAANDGMLHAINADTGRELWSYIPTMVLPKLYKLADKNYVHEFFVDGTPEIGDVFDGTSWRTILVGGLNKGGKGYYALDVTDPLAPKALWQYCDDASLCSQTDANMGSSYGNPVITKLGSDWVVLFTSGYNNADGKGYLYAVNAITGANKFSPIVTACTGANCGISKIAPWIESFEDNTTTRVYGGDLDGNLWRFDVNNIIAPAGRDAFKLAQVGNPPTLTQSITTKPGLAKVDNDAVVFVGTGRFLGVSDKTDSSVNSFYAIKDKLTTTGVGLVRTSGVLVKQTLTFGTSKNGQNIIKNSNSTVDWSTKSGWYLDLPNVGERVFTDPAVVLGVVTFTTNIPTIADPCSGGGVSWLYELNWQTGGSSLGAEKTASGDLISAKFLANEFATRPVVAQLPNGEIITIVQLNTGDVASADGSQILSQGVRIDPLTLPDRVQGHRAGWREIIPER